MHICQSWPGYPMRLPDSAHIKRLSPTKSSALLFSFMSCLRSYWKPSALSCTFFMARPEISWVLAQDGSQHTASGVEHAILNPCACPINRSAEMLAALRLIFTQDMKSSFAADRHTRAVATPDPGKLSNRCCHAHAAASHAAYPSWLRIICPISLCVLKNIQQ